MNGLALNKPWPRGLKLYRVHLMLGIKRQPAEPEQHTDCA